MVLHLWESMSPPTLEKHFRKLKCFFLCLTFLDYIRDYYKLTIIDIYIVWIRYFKFLVCLLFIQVKAQLTDVDISLDYVHTNFTTKDGLPSNETYCILQDSKGLIWIGTDRGLVKYDGYDFIVYTTLDGLLDNVILSLKEDNNGNIWYTCFNTNEVGYIDSNLNFQTKFFNQQLIAGLSKIDHSNIYFNEIHEGVNSMFIVNKELGYVEITDDSIDIHVNGHYYDINGNKGLYLIDHDGVSFIYADVIQYKNVDIPFHLLDQDTIIHSYTKDTGNMVAPTYIKNDSIRYIYDGNDQFEISTSNIVKHTKLGMKYLVYEVSDLGYIYSSSSYKGESLDVYFSTSPKLSDKKEVLLNGVAVTGVLYDSKGQLWLTTAKHGLYYFPELSSKKALTNYQVESLLPLDSGIYIEVNQTRNNDGLYYNYEKERIEIRNARIDKDHIDKDVSRNNFFGAIMIHDDKLSKRWTYDVVTDKVNIQGVQVWSDSLQFFWNRNFVLKVVDTFSWEYYRIRDLNFESDFYYPRIKSAYCKKNGECYLATANGIYYYHKESIKKLPYDNGKYIKDITYNEEFGVLMYSLWGEGLVLQYDNGDTRKITTSDGLTSNFINQIYEDESGVIWLVTNNGINETLLTTKGLSINNRFQSTKLLNSPNVLQIFKKDSVLYVGTDAGLNVLNLKYIENHDQSNMPLFIDSIKVEGYDSLNDYRDLEYNQNNIRIYYTGISYSQYGDINYRYRLVGLFDNWIYTKERKVVFMSLEQGDYQFELESQNENGEWVSLDIPPVFTINKPYWTTWWFIGGGVLLSLLLIGGILFYYIRNIRKEKTFIEQEKRLLEELNESQQKALSSQLNPHFVFNSLNSMQNFILTKRTELSSDYLSKFSKLMRFVFENSKKLYVPLSDEIEALELYLELEEVRHNHKFSYQIKDNILETEEIQIPALLVQPIIENAIWHGLLHKPEDNRILEVCFSSSNMYLQIEIKDNGVGRKASVLRSKPKFIKKQRSSGVELTKQRLNLLSQSTGLETSFEIIDLYNDLDKSIGTSVKILIPLHLR